MGEPDAEMFSVVWGDVGREARSSHCGRGGWVAPALGKCSEQAGTPGHLVALCELE